MLPFAGSFSLALSMLARISPAEWQVLDALWDRSPATAAEVFAALGSETSWHFKTVNTFLARLVEKKAVGVHRAGNVNLYTVLVTRAECVRQESDTFLQRVFRGAAGPMLAHFCEQAKLSDAEIAGLRKILDERSKPKTKQNKSPKKH